VFGSNSLSAASIWKKTNSMSWTTSMTTLSAAWFACFRNRSSGAYADIAASARALSASPRLRVSASLLLFTLLLTSCHGTQRKTIAVVPKATAHLFWVTVHAGAAAAGKDLNVDIDWNGPSSETDYARQVQIVDSMIARQVDGLVVAAQDRTTLNASLDRAAAAHIPVTVFDSGVDSTNYMTYIATNNYQGGQMAARKLAALLNGKGKVAMLMNAPGSKSTLDRESGFEDVLQKEFPNMHIVARQFSMSDRAKGMAVAENFLTAQPDLDGMFASSEPSSVGAALALKSRGLAGKVKLVAFDASDDLVQDLKDGSIDALVAQDPFKMGYEAVKTLVDKLKGASPPKVIDLSATVVTKGDLDRPDIKALLFPDVRKYLN
jgi:ribose transport system substrate-binding protein